MVDLIITSLEQINAFDITTGDYLFTLDELQNASISQGQEKVDITGKQGRKLSSFKRNKTMTISGQNGLLSCGLVELQTGSKFEEKTAEVMWTDFLTVSSGKATTMYKAIGTAGAEISELYVLETIGTVRASLKQDTAAAAGKFTYDPETKELVFDTATVPDGSQIAVYYKRKIAATVLSNQSDKYSSKCELYVDCIGEDKCANLYHVQFHIPKADFNGEFELTFGDDQTVHNFEAEGLSGACGAGATFWDMIVFGQNEADAN